MSRLIGYIPETSVAEEHLCPTCGKNFKTGAALEKHLKSHEKDVKDDELRKL